MGLVGGVGSRGRESGLLLGRWSRRRLTVGERVAVAFVGEGAHGFRVQVNSAADAGAASIESGSPGGLALEGSCQVLASPRETREPMAASNWKIAWWSRSGEQGKAQFAEVILAQHQYHLCRQIRQGCQGCWLQGYQERYRVADSLRCEVSSPAAWAVPARLTVHTPRKAGPRRLHSTLMVCCAQPPDFQPDCESSSWVAMTEAAGTGLAADLADNTPKFAAGMASSSSHVRHKSAAAAAVVVANIAKEQTGQEPYPSEPAGAS
jgi:hypothetical protein